MPTVFRFGPYRFYFYSHDLQEPPHVHVDAGGKSAKIWLEHPSIARNVGHSSLELREVLRLAQRNRIRLLEAWHEYFRAEGR